MNDESSTTRDLHGVIIFVAWLILFSIGFEGQGFSATLIQALINAMKLASAGLALYMAAVASAATWSGDLVDAECFQSEQRNVNPDYISMLGAVDLGFDIRACYPRASKTRTFIVVLTNGESYRLDAAGNTQAAKLVQMAGKRGPRQHYFVVTVTGTISKYRVNVDSIRPGSRD